MGGINHQPTNRTSEELTVPAAHALTAAMAQLMLGNCSVERTIIASRMLEFGVAKTHLADAAKAFGTSRDELRTVREFVDKMLMLFDRGDYVPFATGTIDVDALVATFIERRLVPDAKVVRDTAARFRDSGFSATFFALRELTLTAKGHLDKLAVLTDSMIDGPAGDQGYFWFLVETNTVPWRQRFAEALTSLNELLLAWQTSALLSTELHLQSTGMPSLVAAPATAPAGELV